MYLAVAAACEYIIREKLENSKEEARAEGDSIKIGCPHCGQFDYECFLGFFR